MGIVIEEVEAARTGRERNAFLARTGEVNRPTRFKRRNHRTNDLVGFIAILKVMGACYHIQRGIEALDLSRKLVRSNDVVFVGNAIRIYSLAIIPDVQSYVVKVGTDPPKPLQGVIAATDIQYTPTPRNARGEMIFPSFRRPLCFHI